MSLTALLSLWDRMWFDKQSPAPVCLFRIFYGLLVIGTALTWLPNLLTFFGPHGLLPIAADHRSGLDERFSLLFFLPRTDASVMILYAVLLAAACALALGFCTRGSLIVTCVTLISFHQRNMFINNSGDTLLRVMGMILLFAPCGEMFSVDRWLSDKRSGRKTDIWSIVAPVWTTRLLQLQVALVYWTTFWAKLDNSKWLDGTAVYYVSRVEVYRRLPIPFVFDNWWTCCLATWIVLAIEFSLCSLIWIREFRYWILAAATMMHLLLDWCLSIAFFQYIMVASFCVFLYPEDIRRALAWAKNRLMSSASRKVA